MFALFVLICVQLYPPDSIRWIQWITHKYSATVGCRDFPHYASRGKAITGTVLKFAGYIHHYIILPESIFGLIWKKQDGHHRCFFISHEAVCRDFSITPSRAKGILIDRVFRFTGYLHQYKSLNGICLASF